MVSKEPRHLLRCFYCDGPHSFAGRRFTVDFAPGHPVVVCAACARRTKVRHAKSYVPQRIDEVTRELARLRQIQAVWLRAQP